MYNTESETLSQIIYNDFLSCLVCRCEQKLTFLFDFRHFKLDLLDSIYPTTQREEMQNKNKINNQSNIHTFLTIICQVVTFLSLGREETKSLSLGFKIKISGISYLPFWRKPRGLGAGGAVLEINMTT